VLLIPVIVRFFELPLRNVSTILTNVAQVRARVRVIVSVRLFAIIFVAIWY